jgi:DNA-directed RNA polymerases I, II, and III subunit RPABC1
MISIASATNLLKVLRTQIQMVRDRGYVLDDNDKVWLNYDPSYEDNVNSFINYYRALIPDNKTPFRQSMKKVYIKGEGGNSFPPVGDKLLIYYASPEAGHQTIGIGPVKTIISETLKIEQLGWLIIISESEFTSEAIKELAKIKTFPIQHFLDIALTYNPTCHYLVPKHIPLSEEQAQAYERKNNIRRRQLPILRYGDLQSRAIEKKKKILDPIVSYYGFRPGQIIRIVRNNFITETLIGQTIAHRLVWY